MPPSPAYRPDPQYQTLGPEYADAVEPADFPQAIIRYRNQRWAERVGLGGLTDEEWIAAFARFQPLPDNQAQRLAMRYHGHQFRVYNPDLGDGRGFLFAQLRDDGGRLLDLGTKGSGRTPWSRDGDGRLTLKGGVREVLATEMLEALGVPTSKSFSLIETGEALYRGDEPSPTRSSVLTRLSWSHIRFGSFQRLAFFNRADLMGPLVEHVVQHYYPELAGAADLPAALMEAITARAARLAARWMAAGFVHGVLNTDNLNVTGESFDYGPWRFLPHNDPNFTAAYFDHSGLYAFGRQPEAVFWNLQQLAGCLTLLTETEPLIAALNSFRAAYRDALLAAMLARLGVKSRGRDQDIGLVEAMFAALALGGERARWEPVFFDWFCGAASEPRALSGPRAALYAEDGFGPFREQLQGYEPERPERLAHAYFAQPEPEEMLIDEVEALWAPIAERDDWSAFEAKLGRLAVAREGWALREWEDPA